MHSHGNHCHHEDDHLPPPDSNAAQTLYPYIDHNQVITLNESESGTGAKVLRAYEDKLETDPLLESDVDPELLMTIPFTGSVKMHSLLVRSNRDGHAPARIHLFKNRLDLDFGLAQELPPVQTLNYPADVGVGSSENHGIVEFALNRPKFANITSLSLYIPENQGEDTTTITYIGLRGEWQPLSKPPSSLVYEAAANPRDHKISQRDTRMGEASM